MHTVVDALATICIGVGAFVLLETAINYIEACRLKRRRLDLDG